MNAFRECDIRGEYGTDITDELAYSLGRAVATVLPGREVIVAGDFRLSTPQLMEQLTRGLVDNGARVVELGQVSTPCYYFARRHLGIAAGIMVTASHSPSNCNGFKPVFGALPVTPDDIRLLGNIVASGGFGAGTVSGVRSSADVKREYVGWLAGRFADLAHDCPRMVLDCGHGATGWVVRELIASLDLPATVLFGHPDGRFPARAPDIAGPEDLKALQAEVLRQGAVFGAGFDGDGDRVGFVDELGDRVSSDLLVACLARETLRDEGLAAVGMDVAQQPPRDPVERQPGGTVICDVKLSKAVSETVLALGGTVVVEKSGHTFIKRAMIERRAVLGGEFSGHLFFRELAGGDDGLFSALLVASLISTSGRTLSHLLRGIPRYCSSRDIRIRSDQNRDRLIGRAAEHAKKQGAHLVLVDGVKAEYPAGWALVRASVTESAFTFRFEGNTRKDMLSVAESFLGGLGELGERVRLELERG